MADVSEWDVAAANNNSAPPDGFPENMLPGKVNDSAREVMAAIARWYKDLLGTVTTGGSSNAYTLTSNVTYAALSDQGLIHLRVDRDCTGNATLNVDSLGAKSWYKSQLLEEWESGELRAGMQLLIGYDATGDYYYTISGHQAAGKMPTNYLSGLTISNNGSDSDHDLDIAAGGARDGTDVDDLRLVSALSGKQLDTGWAVGASAGMLDTGSIAADTTYHIWLIKRSDTGVVDVLGSTSASSPTMPTNYDLKRRIGSVLTDGSANIIAFTQHGDTFWLDTRILSVTFTTDQFTAALETLDVPLGIKVSPHLQVRQDDNGFMSIEVYPVEGAGAETNGYYIRPEYGWDTTTSHFIAFRTNTSGQLYFEFVEGDGTGYIYVQGWVDRRGQDGDA